MAAKLERTGGCLCGAVRFEVTLASEDFHICHCGMCRKWAGGPLMALACTGGAKFTDKSGLAWYQGSKWAERGFCSKCGSSLFWRLAEDHDAMLVVAVESLDDAGGLSLHQHIYVDAKPAHYDFADDRPRLTEAEFLASIGITPGVG